MTSKIQLSICIPTFNRSKYLDVLLERIASQVGEEDLPIVQVCISDNASTDDTEAMVARWIKKTNLQILYSKLDTNEGADKNYLRAVSLASGNYCWLFGSDDLFADGAVNAMMESIKSGAGIYLCNRVNCDINMNRVSTQNWLLDDVESRAFDFSIGADLSDYLKSSTSIGALFSYLSSIVFKRDLWNSYEFEQKYIGSAYSHVYMLLAMVKGGCDLKYIKDPLVLNRGGNDSFLGEGSAKRILIDLNGYSMLADDFFLDSEHYNLFLDVLKKKERPAFRTIISLRYYANDEEWVSAKLILKKLKYSDLLVNVVSYLKPVISVARNFQVKL